MTLSELWNDFVTGDESAFSNLFILLYPDLYGYGMSFGFSKEDVDDAIQEIFLKLYKNKDSDIKGAQLKYYLLRSLKNRLIDVNRLSKINIPVDSLSYEFILKVSVDNGVYEKEEVDHICNKVQTVLDQLTEHQREVIYLRFIEEMEYEDIALMLDMKTQTVRAQVYKSLEKLRKLNHVEYILLLTILQCQYAESLTI